MQYRWVYRSAPESHLVEELATSLNNLPLSLSRVLAMRGVDTFDKAKDYFRPSIERLHDPFQMLGMQQAVDRLIAAKQRSEKIMVYGDYDVDGTTSTAMMTLFLRSLGFDVRYWIPHRIHHGYGLCKAGIDSAVSEGATVIVALDCGITAIEEVAYARSLGVDVIICDHHKPGPSVPEAVAVLDPKQDNCAYPFDELSGCGVGFKLIQAMVHALGEPADHAYEYLDFVAVSTACDLVPLIGENRVLMREGLGRIHDKPRTGLSQLARVAKVDLSTLDVGRLVFAIGPRINAAGRLNEANEAVDLLLATDHDEAFSMAEQLNIANDSRREMDRQTLKEAVVKAERQLGNDHQHSIVVHDAAWHSGIVGIVASRLVERFYRPTIMLTTVNGEVKGSARSIEGVNIYNALKACGDLLSRYGGHDYAAGLSLDEENLPVFKERFNTAIGEMMHADLMVPVLHIDSGIHLDEVDKRFWAVLKQFAPFGQSNKEPVFHAEDLILSRPPVRMGRDGAHVKFWVRHRTGGRHTFQSVGFGMHHHFEMLQQSAKDKTPVELLFTVSENAWNGVKTLQLKARDVRIQRSTIC